MADDDPTLNLDGDVPYRLAELSGQIGLASTRLYRQHSDFGLRKWRMIAAQVPYCPALMTPDEGIVPATRIETPPAPPAEPQIGQPVRIVFEPPLDGISAPLARREGDR